MHLLPMRLFAPAKLNITLDVIGKREDGYHALDMINIRLSFGDTLHFTPALFTRVTYEGMKKPKRDIVTRAIELYAACARKPAYAHVHVIKRIPSEAGLGGGSADAAAALNALQAHYDALDEKQMQALALKLGADVPYCLRTDACRVQGIGERVYPLKTPPARFHFLLVKPLLGVSTKALFQSLKISRRRPDTDAAQTAFEAGDAIALGALCENSLFSAAQAQVQDIASYRARLMELGALGASMSGSGSAVFGIFADEAAAERAKAACADIPFCVSCYGLS